jgi:maleylpyruvate isomerase
MRAPYDAPSTPASGTLVVVLELSDEAPSLARAVLERTAAISEMLLRIDRAELAAPSRLPGWTRLTIACHLRYGASALLQMTRDAFMGRPASYYPDGRERQRPRTLTPRRGEEPIDVVASLAGESFWLDQAWRDLSPAAWSTKVVEPEDNVDLGSCTLSVLALLRLTEVEVHGTDLDIGLDDWSDEFVTTALPLRVRWLETRRNRSAARDLSIRSWLLRATDGPTFFVLLDGDDVHTELAEPTENANAVIEGTSRNLLALLLGRPVRGRLRTRGNVEIAQSFTRAFPGP